MYALSAAQLRCLLDAASLCVFVCGHWACRDAYGSSFDFEPYSGSSTFGVERKGWYLQYVQGTLSPVMHAKASVYAWKKRPCAGPSCSALL